MQKPIKKIAVCGGAGSFLLSNAIESGVDAFVTADITYHTFFEANNKILLIDIGHYESEQFTKDLIQEILNDNSIKSIVSKINTNSMINF